MMQSFRPKKLQKTNGFSLFSVLLSLMILVSFAMVIQRTAQSQTQIFKKVTQVHQDALIFDATRAYLSPLVGDVMLSAGEVAREGFPELNGSEFDVEVLGQKIAINVQDVEGLVDLYLASDELIEVLFGEMLPRNPIDFVAARQELRVVGRGFTIENSLAKLGMDEANIGEITDVLTQSARSSKLNSWSVSNELKGRIAVMNGIKTKPVKLISVRLKIRPN